MKLRNRRIWTVALFAASGIALAQAAERASSHAAPVVQLPQDAQRVVVPTPLGGPTVSLPAREGIPLTAPKVQMPALIDPPKVHTKEAGPVVYLPQR